MATSSKKVSVFVPERKENRVRKRYAKRQTTVRAFTFVKDWQSPALDLPDNLVQASTSKKTKNQLLREAVSSASAAPITIDNNAVLLSPASLSRVSPSPLLIPNQSPRARLLANSNQKQASSPATSSQSSPNSQVSSQKKKKKESSEINAAGDFRTPQSPPSIQRIQARSQPSSQSSTTSSKSTASSQSGIVVSLQSSTRGHSSVRGQSSARKPSSDRGRSSTAASQSSIVSPQSSARGKSSPRGRSSTDFSQSRIVSPQSSARGQSSPRGRLSTAFSQSRIVSPQSSARGRSIKRLHLSIVASPKKSSARGQSSSRGRSKKRLQSSRSIQSSQRTSSRSNSRIQQNNGSVVNNNNSTKDAVQSAQRERKSKKDVTIEIEVPEDELAVSDVDEHPGADEIPSDSSIDEEDVGELEDAVNESDSRKRRDVPAQFRTSVQSVTRSTARTQNRPSARSLLKTPAEKSMSIIHRTPVSGPANRAATKRRRPSPVPRKGGKEVKKTKSKAAPTGSKAKVRLWIGSGRRRTAVDTTDLDVILAKVEDMALEYRENLSSKAQKKGVGRFYQYVERDLTDKIDLAQEHKTLKSSLVRMSGTVRKRRKQLLALQQQNVRLDMEINNMKMQATNKEDKDKALHNISTFLSTLQNLQKQYAETKPEDDTVEDNVNSSNLDAVLKEVKVTTRSRQKLRGMNNQLQGWLDAH